MKSPTTPSSGGETATARAMLAVSQTSPLQWFKALSDALEQTECKTFGEKIDLEKALESLMNEWIRLRDEGKRVWWVGNGGSAALCSHLSQDLLNKVRVKSQTLNDPSLITCMANDFGYPNVYARPLEVLMNEGDMLIAISSSGQSKNILETVRVANLKAARIVTVSGFSAANPLHSSNAFLSFYLPSSLYGITEVGHEALVHAAIETLWLKEKTEPAVDLKPLGRDQ